MRLFVFVVAILSLPFLSQAESVSSSLPDATSNTKEAVYFRDLPASEIESGAHWKEIKKQNADHKAAVANYKKSWTLEDVKMASVTAFTTADAAWPFENLAYHIIVTSGNGNDAMEEESKTEAVSALNEAEKILGEDDSAAAQAVRDKIASNRGYLAGH